MQPKVKRIAVVVVLGSIMSIIDTTVVNVALASLARNLHAQLKDVQWFVSAYLLSLAAVIPIGGWAVRRFGAFRVYLQALALFTLASLLCAASTVAPELVLFRALQGIGGGLLLPTGMTILIRAADRTSLPQVMSAIGTPLVLAPVFGPTLGGFLLQAVSWHAIFLINVPIGLLTGIAAWQLLPRDNAHTTYLEPLDWLGFLLAGTGTVALTFGLVDSATAGSFASLYVVAPLTAGAVALGAFVLRSTRVRHPLLDLRLYLIRAYSSASAVIFFLGAALFSAMFLLPLYFQDARSDDALRTGLLLIPQGIGSAIGMNRSARATHRIGAGLTSLLGVLILTIGTFPFLFIQTNTPYWLIEAAMLVRGIGVGLAFTPATTAAFASVRNAQVDDASPQLNMIQRVGGSLGTAIIAVVLQSRLAHVRLAPQSPARIARSFDQTYRWVIGMSIVALVPSILLWRTEHSHRNDTNDTFISEEAVIEVLG